MASLKILDDLHGVVLGDNNLSMKTNMIKAYSLCSNQPNIAQRALEIFHSIPDGQQSVISIGAMMKCCIHSGHDQMALTLYHSFSAMHDDVMHLLAIKAAMKCNDQLIGSQIIESVPSKYWINLKLINTVIDFHGHFGDVISAQKVFDGIPSSKLNVICIGTMMKVLVHNDRNEEAMSFYGRFEGIKSLQNDVTKLLALKAAVHLNDHEAGRSIIASIESTKSLELQNSMIHFFGHFGDLESAENVFRAISMERKNVAVINCMMQCYIQCQRSQRALDVFDEYRNTVSMNDISLRLGLKAAMKSNALECGQRMISWIESVDKLRKCILLQTTLIDFYGHFGDVESAENVFDSIPQNKRDIVCIGAMMKCLLNNGLYERVLELHDALNSLNDTTSHSMAIKASAKLKWFEVGRSIIDSLNGDDADILVINTLIDFYGDSDDVESAERMFNESLSMKKRDIVTVNAMMNCYFTNRLDTECIHLFYRLIDGDSDFCDLEPNNISYAVALKSCAQSTALHHGQRVHQHLSFAEDENGNPMDRDVSVQINLINFYGKCGAMTECKSIWREIEQREYGKWCKERNLWNVMIHSFARNGDIDAAMKLFDRMRDEMQMNPDRKSFILMINGFSYSGNVDRASSLWKHIGAEEVKYDEYVVSAMIDCLSRNKEIERAHQLIAEYDDWSEHRSNAVMWMSLMNGCRATNNVRIAKLCYHQFVTKFADDASYLSAATVLMSNIERMDSNHSTFEILPTETPSSLER